MGEEQSGEYRLEEVLEANVMEVCRNGSVWGELKGGVGERTVHNDGESMALWVMFWEGHLKQSDRLSKRVL